MSKLFSKIIVHSATLKIKLLKQAVNTITEAVRLITTSIQVEEIIRPKHPNSMNGDRRK